MESLILCLMLSGLVVSGHSESTVNKIDTAVGIGETALDNGQTDRLEAVDLSEYRPKSKRQQSKPNIVFIMADDLGWNDIGYHNSEVISPILDDLAANGRILNYNYVPPVCSPSRHAFLTGRQPYATTMQHLVITGVSPHCTPLDLTLLPEKLQGLGYETAISGKWHLGYCRQECTPMERGFDHQFGLMHGQGGYYNHQLESMYDFRDNMVTDWSLVDSYTTDLVRDRAVSLIGSVTNPLFMFVSFTAVHTPLEVPQSYYDMYPTITNLARRKYLAMMTAMDDAVGAIVQSLKDSGKWDNTLLIFSSDNGGESGGHADNSPLRGCKASLYEGGTRVVGFISGGAIQNAGTSHDGLFHSVDWMPTLLHVAGGTAGASLDGLDQYEMIMNGGASARTEIVYNIDMEPEPLFGQAAIRVGDYKLIWGHEGYCDGWGIDVTNFWFDESQCTAAGMTECPADSRARRRRGSYTFSDEEMAAMLLISESKRWSVDDINSGSYRLFNIATDPNEQTDLAGDAAYATTVTDLKQRLIDIVNAEYVGPPMTFYENRATTVMSIREVDPNDSTHYGWGIGFCNDVDILMPTK